MAAFDCAVLVSSLQPAHAGHAAALAQARALAPRTVLLVHGADAALAPRTPWSTEQRLAAARMLVAGDPAVTVRAVRDVPYDAERRAAALTDAAAADGRVVVIEDAGLAPGLPAGWVAQPPAVPLEPVSELLRDALLWHGDAVEWPLVEAHLSGAQRSDLHAFSRSREAATLREEAAFLRAFRARWADAPYPPVFVTVDALVTRRDEVLLIRRGRAPGRGLWALPGGFLDQHETLEAGARRELAEESGLELGGAAAREVRVFDAPQRSLRGRTVTHVFRFALDGAERPAVFGGDDADRARWVSRTELEPTRFFEDHHAILQVMLGID